MTVTVGINGFGRIGRCTLAHIAESGRNDIHVAKINATGPIETNAHLLRYDSVHGRFAGTVSIDNNALDLGRGWLLLLLLAVVKRGGLEGGVALRRSAGFELFGCGPRPAVGGSSSGWSLFRRASTLQPASRALCRPRGGVR